MRMVVNLLAVAMHSSLMAMTARNSSILIGDGTTALMDISFCLYLIRMIHLELEPVLQAVDIIHLKRQ